MVCRISWKRGLAALVFLAAAVLCLVLAMSSCKKSRRKSRSACRDRV